MNDLERKAWDVRTTADQHPPVMAAKAFVDQVERGDLVNIKHVLIVAVEDIDGGDYVHVLQAGSLSELAAEAALMRAVRHSQDA